MIYSSICMCSTVNGLDNCVVGPMWFVNLVYGLDEKKCAVSNQNARIGQVIMVVLLFEWFYDTI